LILLLSNFGDLNPSKGRLISTFVSTDNVLCIVPYASLTFLTIVSSRIDLLQ